MAGEREHFIALDSLRGVSALVVVLFHLGSFGWIASLAPVRSGWLLVDFFFILSGFVIAASYGARLGQGYPKGRFMLLRAFRVLPLHYAVLVVMTLLTLAVFGPVLGEVHNWWEFWRSVFLLDAFRPQTGNWFTPVSWTLAVEMYLYVYAMLLYGRGRFGAAITVLGALAAAWCLWSGTNPPVFGSLMQRGVLGFALGTGAYYLHRRWIGWRPSAAVLTLAEAAILAAIVAVLALVPQSRASVIWVDAVFFPAVLVFARDGGAVSRALHANWLVRLGQLSFAIYMTHLFVVIGLNRALPRLFAATGQGQWVVPGLPSFGLTSVELGDVPETLISLGVLAVVPFVGWLAWRFVEEPARKWSRDAFGHHKAEAALSSAAATK